MSQEIITFNNFVPRCALPFFAALTMSLIFTPLVRRIAIKYKFVAYPKQDRWRQRVVASLGGIAIFASFLLSYIIFGAFRFISVGFVFGAFGIFWLGLIDDIVHIKPDTKLIGQIIVACVTVMFGIKFNITSTPIIDIPLTIIWIVSIINAFNLLDNMDGLSAGVASIASLILCVHSFMNHNSQVVLLSLTILGASIGFLRFNFNPAKIFMGDCGSMFLGYALATAALIGTIRERSGLLITMAIPALVLTVPIFDTVFVTLARIINNRPISQGGRDHTSHRLVILGLSERNAVLLLYAVSFVCGSVAILCTILNFVHMSIAIALLLAALIVFGVFLGTEVKVYSSDEANDPEDIKAKNGRIFFNGFVYNKRRIIEVILDFVIISVSFVAAFLLRFEGFSFMDNVPLIIESLPMILVVKLVIFYLFGLYRGVWRYIGLYDVIAILKATVSASLASMLLLLFMFRFINYSRTVFIIDWLLTFVAVCGIRVLFRLYREFFANIRLTGRRVLIYGAGDAGELALREIRQNRALAYKPIGFVDDDEHKTDRMIHGVKVLGRGSDIEKVLYKYKIDEILIAIPVKGNKRRLEEVRALCDKINVAYLEVSKIIQVREKGAQ